MNDLDWLIGRRFQELIRYEYGWNILFDEGAGIGVTCLWRLVENGRVRFTSDDDGHQFGLPSPVDDVLEINQRLAGVLCTGVTLREGTLDLELRFETGHALQIIPDSSGYEAWNARSSLLEHIAQGGGNLAVFKR